MAEMSVEAVDHGVESRRGFLTILTASAGIIGAAATIWPFVAALGPDADGESAAQLIVNVSGIAENTAIAVRWAGLPVYIRKLTDKQVADNEFVVPSSLPDPASFTDRVKPGYEHFVVVVGLNTGVACELEGNDPGEPRGPYDGWLCPCDGSVYDPLGRVRGGPAKRNLAIPPFKFLNDAQIQFG